MTLASYCTANVSTDTSIRVCAWRANTCQNRPCARNFLATTFTKRYCLYTNAHDCSNGRGMLYPCLYTLHTYNVLIALVSDVYMLPTYRFFAVQDGQPPNKWKHVLIVLAGFHEQPEHLDGLMILLVWKAGIVNLQPWRLIVATALSGHLGPLLFRNPGPRTHTLVQ